jgi:hypothetical protein
MLAPVPILRHYYLATVGVAWLVGVLVLDRPRRTWATAIVVAVLNLALPEAAYTAFRMRTGASKTPHGTFFSAHRYWAARVDGFVAMRDRSAACWDATATPSTFALVTWEGAAHVLYRLGISERRVRRIAKESIYPGVDAIDLDYEGGRLRLVQYVYFEDPVLRARVRAMVEDARAHGECIVFPAELGDALGVAADDAANLVAY